MPEGAKDVAAALAAAFVDVLAEANMKELAAAASSDIAEGWAGIDSADLRLLLFDVAPRRNHYAVRPILKRLPAAVLGAMAERLEARGLVELSGEVLLNPLPAESSEVLRWASELALRPVLAGLPAESRRAAYMAHGEELIVTALAGAVPLNRPPMLADALAFALGRALPAARPEDVRRVWAVLKKRVKRQ